METLSVIENEIPRKGFHCLTPKFAIKFVQKSAKTQKTNLYPYFVKPRKHELHHLEQ